MHLNSTDTTKKCHHGTGRLLFLDMLRPSILMHTVFALAIWTDRYLQMVETLKELFAVESVPFIHLQIRVCI